MSQPSPLRRRPARRHAPHLLNLADAAVTTAGTADAATNAGVAAGMSPSRERAARFLNPANAPSRTRAPYLLNPAVTTANAAAVTRVGTADATTTPTPAREFPGRVRVDDASLRARLAACAASLLLHGALLATLALLAALAPATLIEELIPVTRLADGGGESAPRPRAVARARTFAHAQPQALARVAAARVASPTLVQPRASVVEAARFAGVATLPTPQQQRIERARVTAVADVPAVAPTPVPTARAQPALSAARVTPTPVLAGALADAPLGKSVGPRAAPEARSAPGADALARLEGARAPVSAALPSSRDAFGGSPRGERASVNWALSNAATGVGTGSGAGTGSGTGDGSGSGAGASRNLCDADDAECARYLSAIRDRVRRLWNPAAAAGVHRVTLKFRISPQGEVRRLKVESAASEQLGASALRAMTAAAPFPLLPARLRALANHDLLLTFEIETQ